MEQDASHAYAAGVLDSDGYFSIIRDEALAWSKSPYRVKIGIKQLWPGPGLRFIASSLGGEVRYEDRGKLGRPMARWELYGEDAVPVIETVEPYLLVKKSQALMLKLAQELMESGERGPALWGVVNELRERVIKTNRGFIPSPPPEPLEPAQSDRFLKETSSTRDINVLAYLAGVMHSDGNFKIERKRVDGMLNPHYRIALRASQVAPSPAIDLFAHTFGGNVRVRESRRDRHRPLAYWALYDRSAEPAIAALLPYLVTKAPEAALLLRLRALKAQPKEGLTTHVHPNRWHDAVRMRKRCHSPGQVRAMDRLYLTLRALHAGVPPFHLPGHPVPKRGRLTEDERALLEGPS